MKYLDKRIGSFMGYSTLLLAVLGAATILFSFIYKHFTIDFYNSILLIAISLSIIIALAVATTTLAAFTAVKKTGISPLLLAIAKFGLKMVIPFALFVTGLLKKDKNIIRSLYIDINNMLVQSGGFRKSPDKILLLLPHCLQNSDCDCKITGEITKCRKCGRCTIGEILTIVERTGVNAAVVTGGTAARNIIARQEPEIVLSVACERDLAAGISDVSRIPVLGVLNSRPNGPCLNTTVDVQKLYEKLTSILALNTE